MANISLVDENKKLVRDAGGVEALTSIFSSSSQEARGHATEALETLADVARENDLAEQRKEFGVEGMVSLCEGDNPLILSLAAENLQE